MFDRSQLLELFLEIEEAIRRIEWRFEGITKPEDFTTSRNGLDRLDGIGMMLIAISENVRRMSKLVNNDFFDQYPEVNWSEVKALRNFLAHNYFDIDPDEIYIICSQDLSILKQASVKIRYDIFQ